MKRIEDQIALLANYFQKNNLQEAVKAMNLALKYHVGLRRNGDLEVSHQFELVRVATTIFQNKTNKEKDTILAALFLHDLPEDYGEFYSLKDLKDNFSKDIFDVVKRLTKTKSFTKTPKMYKKYYQRILKNPFSVIGKLVDRKHNLETMLLESLAFKERYIVETELYILPMARLAQKSFPEYCEEITFLMRELNVLIRLYKHIISLEKNRKEETWS